MFHWMQNYCTLQEKRVPQNQIRRLGVAAFASTIKHCMIKPKAFQVLSCAGSWVLCCAMPRFFHSVHQMRCTAAKSLQAKCKQAVVAFSFGLAWPSKRGSCRPTQALGGTGTCSRPLNCSRWPEILPGQTPFLLHLLQTGSPFRAHLQYLHHVPWQLLSFTLHQVPMGSLSGLPQWPSTSTHGVYFSDSGTGGGTGFGQILQTKWVTL